MSRKEESLLDLSEDDATKTKTKSKEEEEWDTFFGDAKDENNGAGENDDDGDDDDDDDESSSGSDDDEDDSSDEYDEEVVELSDQEEEDGAIGGRLRGIFRKKKKKKEAEAKLSDIMHGPRAKFFTPPAHKGHGEEEEWTLGYIRRYVGEKVTAWHFHKQNGDFLMAASMNSDAVGLCVFSTINNTFRLGDLNSIPRKASSTVYLGCMFCENLGRNFTIFDYRVANPKDKKHKSIHIFDVAHFRYKTNIMARVPNVMKVVLERHTQADAVKARWKSLSDRLDELKIAKVTKEDKEKEKKEDKEAVAYGAVGVREEGELMKFQTKQPVWNEELQAWTLNFDGRVKMASKKNFLLEVEDDSFHLAQEFGEGTEQLRFGKVRKNVYSLDYKYPFVPIVALGAAVSTFAKKMVVT